MEKVNFRPRHEGNNAALQAKVIVAMARHPERGQHLDKSLPEDLQWPFASNKYVVAAMELAGDAIHSVKDHPDRDLIERPAVTHGYRSMFVLLGRSASVYAKYCANKQRTATIDELTGILHRSYGIAEYFARMDNSRNRTWETNFGLRGEQTYGIDEVYIEDAGDELTLELVPEILDLTHSEIAHRERTGKLKSQNPRDICPAVGESLQAEWCRAIQHCATDPKLFAADLTPATNINT